MWGSGVGTAFAHLHPGCLWHMGITQAPGVWGAQDAAEWAQVQGYAGVHIRCSVRDVNALAYKKNAIVPSGGIISYQVNALRLLRQIEAKQVAICAQPQLN
jgi:hypothetical protein